MRLAIVDDDLWVRRGRATALEQVGGLEVAEMAPRAAMRLGPAWAEFDVALVDAHDEREPFDRFPGVGVVENIRQHRRPDETVVIVVTGQLSNDFLRLRMCEAGADFFYGHEDVRDLDALLAAIRDPASARRVSGPEQPARVHHRPNAALAFVEAEGITDIFQSARPQKALPLSRRSIIRIRREVSRLAGITTVTPSGGKTDLSAPEWKTVVEYVNRARGAGGDGQKG